MVWPKLLQYLLQKAFIIRPPVALACRPELGNKDGVTARAHREKKHLTACHILENKQSGRKRIGELYQAKGKDTSKAELNWVTKVSSWFRALAFLHILELDGFS